MKKHYEERWEDLRAKIIGLGEKSARKSYYPELQQRLLELELTNKKLTKEVEERERAEKALRESEKRYRYLLNNQNDAVFVHPLKKSGFARFTDINDIACKRYGYTRQEFLRLTAMDITKKEDVKSHAKPDHRRKLLEQGHLVFETEHITKSGNHFPVEISSNIVEIEGEKIILAVVRDITERKQTEEAFRKSEENYRTLVQSVNSIILRMDVEGNVTFFNDFAQRFFGYKEEEILGRNVVGTIVPETDSTGRDLRAMIKDIGLNPDRYVTNENENICHDGRRVWIAWTNKPIYDDTGTILEVLCVGNDVTDRKQAEEALRESEEKYRLIIENQTDMIVTFDTEGRLLFVSPSYCETFDRSERELLGKKFMPLIHEEGRAAVEKAITNVQKPPYTGYVEERAMTKNGWRWQAWLNTAVLNEEGGIGSIVAVGRDITELKQTEEEKRKLEAQLQQAQKMEAIGTLAGGIAHDFNNILSAIIGFTEISISELKRGSSLFNNLQKVLEAGERAKDLVNQILTFSRQSDLKPKPVQVKLITKDTLKLLRATLPTTIDIHQNFMSNSAAMADPIQIHQVIMNLCTNSAAAMKEKGGKLDVSIMDVDLDSEFVNRHPEMKAGTYIKISVSDTGHGISPEIMERIFDPYYTTKEKGGGTGMGLSVVHGIIKRLGGAITVDSELGKGATFDLYIPAIEKSVPALEPESDLPLPVGTERVLFVDDEELQVDLGKRMLEPLGYKVVVRTSSLEALELFRAKPNDFDLVITDMTMPNMTGDKLAVELLKIKPDIPIILCTGFSAMIDESKARTMGMRAFVFKPILKREIAETIRKVLDENTEK